MNIDDIKLVTVLGAGTMGHGIAELMALQGFRVIISDVQQNILDTAFKRIKQSLLKLAEMGRIKQSNIKSTLDRILRTTILDEAMKEADIAIEAIPEKLELKQELFCQMDKLTRAETVLASNTSTISITEIASVTSRPDKVIGMHFCNPVPLMEAVEIVKGIQTSDATVELVKNLTLKLGKTPVVVKDSPGFLSTRLIAAFFVEASRMLEEGLASVKDIDMGARLFWGHRVGPFEACDIVGLDVRLNNIINMYQTTGDPKWAPPLLLKQLVASGHLGNKPGSKGGYYTYFRLDPPRFGKAR
ncbi:3-hydroxyacyl-CoA dehydrogenase family protein [Chloroflexota bacterium]